MSTRRLLAVPRFRRGFARCVIEALERRRLFSAGVPGTQHVRFDLRNEELCVGVLFDAEQTPPDQYVATIDWGNGTTTPATAVFEEFEGNSQMLVCGEPPYTEPGTHLVTYTLRRPNGTEISGSISLDILPPLPTEGPPAMYDEGTGELIYLVPTSEWHVTPERLNQIRPLLADGWEALSYEVPLRHFGVSEYLSENLDAVPPGVQPIAAETVDVLVHGDPWADGQYLVILDGVRHEVLPGYSFYVMPIETGVEFGYGLLGELVPGINVGYFPPHGLSAASNTGSTDPTAPLPARRPDLKIASPAPLAVGVFADARVDDVGADVEALFD
jgi:hypothetical protein